MKNLIIYVKDENISINLLLDKTTVRQLISSEVISINYVRSKDNISDPLTKCLSRELVEKSSRKMGLWPRTSHHSGNSTL